MKNLIIVLLMIFSISVNAESELVVVPLGGDVTNLLLEPSAIVSSGQWIVLGSNQKGSVYTVPAGKTFVLTDVVFSKATLNQPLQLFKGDSVVSSSPYMTLALPAFSFSSGLTYESGTKIIAAHASGGVLTFAGYLVDE